MCTAEYIPLQDPIIRQPVEERYDFIVFWIAYLVKNLFYKPYPHI